MPDPAAFVQRHLPNSLILADMADLVTRPLDAVRQLFQQTGGSQAGDWGVRAAFEAALADPAVLAKVWFAFVCRRMVRRFSR